MSRAQRTALMAVAAVVAVAVALWSLRAPDPGEDVPAWRPPEVRVEKRVALPAAPPRVPVQGASSAAAGTVDRPDGVAAAEEAYEIPAGQALLEGIVRGVDAREEPTFVMGCGSTTVVEDDGSFRMNIGLEPCEVYATRTDGVLRVRGDLEEVTPSDGARLWVSLEVPQYPAAGVGAGVKVDDLGIRI
ncbi:MAG: hypothetical protein KC656_31900, partial [Myxococcales bacterium]|nr:hypothetical protein [Myxococcales bacterium]